MVAIVGVGQACAHENVCAHEVCQVPRLLGAVGAAVRKNDVVERARDELVAVFARGRPAFIVDVLHGLFA